MRPVEPRRFWRRLRIAFRWVRIVAWLGLLLLLLAVFYVHRIGFPAGVRRLIEQALKEQGVNLDIGRLRLVWYRGLVADQVSLGSHTALPGSALELKEVAFNLDWSALIRGRIEIESLSLLGGTLSFALGADGPGLGSSLVIADISSLLRFDGRGTWSLAELRGQYRTGSVTLSGTITNAPTLLRFRQPRDTGPKTAPGAGLFQQYLRAFVREYDRLQFERAPEVRVNFTGDARDLHSFRVEVRVLASGAATPWGTIEDLRFKGSVSPGQADTGPALASLRFTASGARTPWGDLKGAILSVAYEHPATNLLPRRVDWHFDASEAALPSCRLRHATIQATSVPEDSGFLKWRTELTATAPELETAWGRSRSNRLFASLRHSLSNALPSQARGELQLLGVESEWGSARDLALDADWKTRTGDRASTVPAGAPWDRFAPYELNWRLRANEVSARGAKVDFAALQGGWLHPELSLTNAHFDLYDGTLDMESLKLDVASREAGVKLKFNLDVNRLNQLLPPGAVTFLAQFAWTDPPRARAAASVRLPPWDKPPADPGQELLSTLRLEASVDAGRAAFNGMPFDSAHVDIGISDQRLRLRNLSVLRPEGRAALSYDLNLRTRDFRWRLESGVDAHIAAPAVDRNLPPIVALFTLPHPPHVKGEVYGNWTPPSLVEFDLNLRATNFVFRGQTFDSLEGRLSKSQGVIHGTNVLVRVGAEEASAREVVFDGRDGLVRIHGGQSVMDPMRVARTIGTNVEHIVAPYRFSQPPKINVEGNVPTQGTTARADITFDIAGGPFEFWRFRSPRIATKVRWEGNQITARSLAASFYQGELDGNLALQFEPGQRPQMQFDARVTDIDLNTLLADTVRSTNRADGTVTGLLILTGADPEDFGSWNGYGRVSMRNGMLWNLPIFGLFSRIFNVIIPGIGNSRATGAEASYRIKDSVISTDDLAVEAGPARLKFQGTVDFQSRVNARVFALVFHGMPVIGPVISMALAPATKAMEYKVTGTLAEPVLEPLNIPKFLMPLLNPLGTIQKVVVPAKPKSDPAPK